MMIAQRRAWIFMAGAILLLGGISLVIWLSPWRDTLTSSDAFRDWVLSFGPAAPAAIIVVHASQVILAPIPGQAIDIANGYMFGPWIGPCLSMSGITIGSLIALSLAKRFGRPLVKILATPAGLRSVERYAHSRGLWFFFLLFLLPGTPDDLLVFAIGLSPIPFWRAMLVILLGRLPGVVGAALLGAAGTGLNPLSFMLLAGVISLVIWLAIRR